MHDRNETAPVADEEIELLLAAVRRRPQRYEHVSDGRIGFLTNVSAGIVVDEVRFLAT